MANQPQSPVLLSKRLLPLVRDSVLAWFAFCDALKIPLQALRSSGPLLVRFALGVLNFCRAISIFFCRRARALESCARHPNRR